MKVTLRPLKELDANKSYQWRNDSKIWRFTGNKPSKYITVETERKWLREALLRPDEIRMAICVGERQEYVGNVQLTKITSDDAEFHIFIGESAFLGKGVGIKAAQLMVDYATDMLNLKFLYLRVHSYNLPAIRTYLRCGFHQLVSSSDMMLTYTKSLSK